MRHRLADNMLIIESTTSHNEHFERDNTHVNMQVLTYLVTCQFHYLIVITPFFVFTLRKCTKRGCQTILNEKNRKQKEMI